MIKWIPVLFFTGIVGCKQPVKKTVSPVDEKIALMRTDKEFSDMSVTKGMKEAFIEYIDSNGVLLRPGYLPIAGANAIDFLIQQNDTGYVLSWQPQQAFVSQSADLGYTYGVYAFQPNSVDTTLYGTYVSIWKKQADGKWKFVLDTGNENIDAADFDY
jgi:ketosteroid isomerase-like protein